MEEQITRAIKDIITEELGKYIRVVEVKPPSIGLVDFYQIVIGEPRSLDGYPAMVIASTNWSKYSDDLIYSPNQDIIDTYTFQLTVYLEGDDPTELEFRAIRYREAIKECFRNNSTLNRTARGCIISSGDNYNSIIGEQTIEMVFKLTLEVYGMDQDASLSF